MNITCAELLDAMGIDVELFEDIALFMRGRRQEAYLNAYGIKELTAEDLRGVVDNCIRPGGIFYISFCYFRKSQQKAREKRRKRWEYREHREKLKNEKPQLRVKVKEYRMTCKIRTAMTKANIEYITFNKDCNTHWIMEVHCNPSDIQKIKEIMIQLR